MTNPSSFSPSLSSDLPPSVLVPRNSLFTARALRFAQLASSSLKPWLSALSALASQQQDALGTLDTTVFPVASSSGRQRLPASAASAFMPYWKKIYQEASPRLFPLFAACIDTPAQTLSADELEKRAAQCLEMAYSAAPPSARDAHDMIVAAALQVVWSAAAQTLDWPESTIFGPHAVCPACGAQPVGSIILAGEGKAGLRYLECSLCATRWHAVRARCTLCDANTAVTYLGNETGNPAIQAEACDACHGYIKTYFQTRDALVDPVADDLASLTLDMAVGEAGYSRAYPNLYLAH
jgi:FdhE protein